MATFFNLHPDNPQQRSIEQIIKQLKSGAVMLYPSDTVYAIGCDLNVKSAVERVRQIKQLSNDKPLTFLCPSLSKVATYAVVSDNAYRIMKHLIPGPYTFLLPATKLVPRLVLNPKRKTTGIRVPDNKICLTLLQALENPIVSTSAHLTTEDRASMPAEINISRFELFDRLEKLVDVIIEDGSEELSDRVSTIIDLTQDTPAIVRQGLGWEQAVIWAS